MGFWREEKRWLILRPFLTYGDALPPKSTVCKVPQKPSEKSSWRRVRQGVCLNLAELWRETQRNRQEFNVHHKKRRKWPVKRSTNIFSKNQTTHTLTTASISLGQNVLFSDAQTLSHSNLVPISRPGLEYTGSFEEVEGGVVQVAHCSNNIQQHSPSLSALPWTRCNTTITHYCYRFICQT